MIKKIKNLRDSKIYCYNPGKVGSTAFHKIEGISSFHSLYNNEPSPRDRLIYSGINQYAKSLKLFTKRSIIKNNNEVKIITFARDPLKRNISMFFQDITYWMFVAFKKVRNIDYEKNFNFEDLVSCFEKNFNQEYLLEWFDRELFKFTGIDVFEDEYQKNWSTKYFERNRFKVLLIKYEEIKNPEVILKINNFLGDEIDLKSENVSHNKWYGSLYTEFRNNYESSEQLKSILYDSKYARKFNYIP